MSKQSTEEFTEEEEEVVEFFMELIPIIQEAARDLERKGLLDRSMFRSKES